MNVPKLKMIAFPVSIKHSVISAAVIKSVCFLYRLSWYTSHHTTMCL